jgi:mRNA degradation ribonuclease J1/J2
MLKIIPLGGLGEIGLNMMVFDYGDTLFVVDAGLMFPEDYMLGVDFVIPDMRIYSKTLKHRYLVQRLRWDWSAKNWKNMIAWVQRRCIRFCRKRN